MTRAIEQGAGTVSRDRRQTSPRLQRRAALREAGYLVGLLVTVGAAYALLVLLPGKLKTQQLQTHHDTLAAEVHGLKETTEQRRQETRALEEDPWAVERELRSRGYLRPGEQVFRPER